MDYPLAPQIIEALVATVRASDTGYVGPTAPLAEAFAGFASRAWGWEVSPERVRTTTDVSVTIVETLRMVLATGVAGAQAASVTTASGLVGGGVIITPPVYPPFFDLIPEAGGTVVEVPLINDGTEWSLDLAGIEAAFAAGARAMLLCNPHNPLGLVHPAETLKRVAEIAARYDATVVSDEIHAPLVHPGITFTPFLSVSDEAREHGVAVTAASKAFNLAGLKCAMFVTASDRQTRLLEGMPEEVGFRTSLLGLRASTVAYAEGDDWLAGVRAAIESNRDLLGALLAERLPGVVYRAPSASYLAWLDFRALGWGDDPAARALEVGRVALNPGLGFGTQGRGFARLNFACAPEVLTEAVDRLAAAR
jgi:cystathionine beta-lyase